MRMPDAPLLSVNLSVDYQSKPGALSGVQFQIHRGEIFGLVGGSGSGKSTVALGILRLLNPRGACARGSLLFEGRDLMLCREPELRRVRGRKIGLVPQSPVSALNPVLRLETHFREAWRAHDTSSWAGARSRVRELLREMDLPADDAFLRRYPNQVSVGQAQRVLIAMSVLHRPALLIADEPTSALDIGSQRELLGLLQRLNRAHGMAILFISHDLASVAALCTSVGVLDSGRLVECGPADMLLSRPELRSPAPGR